MTTLPSGSTTACHAQLLDIGVRQASRVLKERGMINRDGRWFLPDAPRRTTEHFNARMLP